MMDGQAPLRIYFSDCETVIRQVTQNLEAAGLRVVRSFDLRSACSSTAIAGRRKFNSTKPQERARTTLA